MTQETPISDKVNRIETIVERIESGDVSLEEAQQLHEEGQTLLKELQDDLEVGNGEIVEH